jgi:hypothetical protein
MERCHTSRRACFNKAVDRWSSDTRRHRPGGFQPYEKNLIYAATVWQTRTANKKDAPLLTRLFMSAFGAISQIPHVRGGAALRDFQLLMSAFGAMARCATFYQKLPRRIQPAA